MKLIITNKGGSGSGDFGHSGRPGQVGGSSGGKGGGTEGTRIVIDNSMHGLSYHPGDRYEDAEGNVYQVDNVISASRMSVTPMLSADKNVVNYRSKSNLYKPDWDIEQGKYSVEQNIEVFEDTGKTEPTNAWYGSARIHRTVYKKGIARSGDSISILPGGYYLTRKGTGNRIKVSFVEDTKGAFEHDYQQSTRYIPVGAMKYLGRQR